MDATTTATEDPSKLRRALRIVTGTDPTRQATRHVVARCHRIAQATLRQQQRTGSLREDVLGEDTGDLAIDAIAGLFERDDQGRFPELREYFGGQLATGCPEQNAESEQSVQSDLRRLVQSAVTDWLFEAYRAADRSLSNQLSALKRAVNQREDACLRRRGRTQWLEVSRQSGDFEQDGSRPRKGSSSEPESRLGRPMPLETLEAHLTGKVAEASCTEDLLMAAIDVLRAHPDYEAAYPLTRLAQAMRAARSRVQAVTEHSGPVSYPDRPVLKPEETRHHIEKTLSALQAEKQSTYVGQGKITKDTYAAYFNALYDRLEARFVPPGDPEMTHHEALAGHLLGLSKQDYRAQHRARFEYLEQEAREALVDRLRDVI